MSQVTKTKDYFTYVPESRLCQVLGCTLQSAGYTEIGPKSQYPAAVHPADHRLSRRTGRILQAFQIVFISEGKGRAEFGGAGPSRKVTSGQVFILFPNVWHNYAPSQSTGWTEHWIECTVSAFDMALNAGLLNPKQPVFRTPDIEAVQNTFQEIHSLAATDAIGNQPVLSMLGLKLLAILTSNSRADSGNSSRLVNAARMLLLECCSENVPMEQIAEQLHVSYSKLRRAFRKDADMSMKDYQMAMRVQKAKDLLDNTNLPLKALASQLGFSSPFHLSNQFKKAEGRSPTEWRARDVEGVTNRRE